MKKKLLVVLSALLAFQAVPLSAAAEGTITPPDETKDYQEYKASEAGNKANEIPGWGYIGIDGTVTPNEKPGEPPTVDPADSNISVQVPTQFLWAAFEGDKGKITAPTYRIKNNSASADLKVTLASFVQKNDVEIPGTLNLNLTGEEMAVTGVVNHEAVDFPKILEATRQWNFSFGGNYDGAFDKNTLGGSYIRPQYEMKLTFAVSH